jgi:hypothetical protein
MTTKQKKAKGIRITTPQGTALYAYLDKPDTKFSDEGVYTVTLRVPKAEGVALQKQIHKMQDEQVKLEKDNGKTPNKMSIPIKENITDDGQEVLDFRFKMKPSYKNSLTGETVEQRPKVFDTQLKPMTELVGSGSKVKVAFIADKYTCPMGVGVALRLSAVQVIDLVSVASKQSSGESDFSMEEGFVSEGSPASTETPEEATSGAADIKEESAASGSDF